MNEIYEESFKDELEKIASDESNISRIRSAAKGALNLGADFATFGALVSLISSGGRGILGSLSKNISKPSFRKALIDAAATSATLGTAGGVLGGARGALYPKGRKTLGGKRSEVGH